MAKFPFRPLWILAAVLISLPSTFTLAQQRPLVESVEILGNRSVTDDDVVKVVKTRPGNLFEEKQAQDDLKSILDLGLFDPAHTRVITETGVRGGVNVIFEIMELPLVTEVVFLGMISVSEEELRAELSRRGADMKVNELYRAETAQRAARILRDYLVKTRGLKGATAFFTENCYRFDNIELVFLIRETPDDIYVDIAKREWTWNGVKYRSLRAANPSKN